MLTSCGRIEKFVGDEKEKDEKEQAAQQTATYSMILISFFQTLFEAFYSVSVLEVRVTSGNASENLSYTYYA